MILQINYLIESLFHSKLFITAFFRSSSRYYHHFALNQISAIYLAGPHG